MSDLWAATDGLDAVNVGTVRDDDWVTVRTRLRRHDADWWTAPDGDGERIVMTTDPDFGAPRQLDLALAEAGAVLERVSERASTDRRQVRMSRSWTADAKLCRNSATDAIPDEVVWLGVLTKAATAESVAEAARRVGGIAAPRAPLSTDIDNETVMIWRIANVAPSDHWKLWARLGLKTWAELAAERAGRTFEDFARRSRRAPIHNPSINRPRYSECAAA